MAAAAGEPLARGERGAFCGGNEPPRLAAVDAGFLVHELVLHGDDGGGVRKTELERRDRRERQLAVFGAAVVAVVR